MNRNALLSIIPKINNEDVIVYDISLSPLLGKMRLSCASEM